MNNNEILLVNMGEVYLKCEIDNIEEFKWFKLDKMLGKMFINFVSKCVN